MYEILLFWCLFNQSGIDHSINSTSVMLILPNKIVDSTFKVSHFSNILFKNS